MFLHPTPNTQHPTPNRQQGVALIIAILVIGIVVLIVLAISQLMTTEFRLVGSLDRSFVAYYAAESGIEDALLQYKENGGKLSLIAAPPGSSVCPASPPIDTCYSVCLTPPDICYTVEISVSENKIYSTGGAYGVRRKLEVEPSPSAAGPVSNLVGNGNFEGGTNPDGSPVGWKALGGSTWEIDSSEGNSVKSTSPPDVLRSKDFISIDTSKGYTALVSIKCENTRAFASILCQDDIGTGLGERYIAFNVSPSEWTDYSITLSGEGPGDNQFPQEQQKLRLI